MLASLHQDPVKAKSLARLSSAKHYRKNGATEDQWSLVASKKALRSYPIPRIVQSARVGAKISKRIQTGRQPALTHWGIVSQQPNTKRPISTVFMSCTIRIMTMAAMSEGDSLTFLGCASQYIFGKRHNPNFEAPQIPENAHARYGLGTPQEKQPQPLSSINHPSVVPRSRI